MLRLFWKVLSCLLQRKCQEWDCLIISQPIVIGLLLQLYICMLLTLILILISISMYFRTKVAALLWYAFD